ncbi:MAG: urate oxidase [Pseudonocardia sp.]|nr:urate oxidase [Pseudonocardia sp.]
MGIRLASNSYGKVGNHLFKVVRTGDRHEVRDYRVDIELTGDYHAAHVEGDNTDVLATDTMRNTVYAVAAQHEFDCPERLGGHLVDHLLTQPRVAGATVRLVEQRWERIPANGRPHDHAFTKASGGRHTATVSGSGAQRSVTSGIEDLQVLKTTQSGWSGFAEGGYRTLRDTDDRILATSVTATWTATVSTVDHAKLWDGVHAQIAETFTDHYSPSVQHTIYRMGQAVLQRFAEIDRISFELPNRHHISYDLAPFGIPNDKEIFWVAVEPYGLITATVERD